MCAMVSGLVSGRTVHDLARALCLDRFLAVNAADQVPPDIPRETRFCTPQATRATAGQPPTQTIVYIRNACLPSDFWV